MKRFLLILFAFLIVALHKSPKSPRIVSTNLITITGNDLYNWTGRKKPQRLFDGDLTQSSDDEFFSNNNIATPLRFFIRLDSTRNHMKIDYFWGNGGATWTVNLWAVDRVTSRTYTFSGTFQNWATVAGQMDTISFPVAYVEFITNSPSSELFELKLYGDAVAKAPNIFPAYVQPPGDPGYKFQGGAMPPPKDSNYIIGTDGSYRLASFHFYWADADTATWGAMPYKFNDLEQSTLGFLKRNNIAAHFYTDGSCILTRPDLHWNSGFNALMATNDLKDIPTGSDSTLYSNWALDWGRFHKVLAHLFGPNPASVLSPTYKYTSNTMTVGQDNIECIQISNEDNKEWKDVTGHHSPEVMLEKLRVAYDSIKSVSPNIPVVLGALTGANTDLLRSIWFINFWKTGSSTMPCDGFCFNQYFSSLYGGQPKGADTYGVSPEQFRAKAMVDTVLAIRDKFYPGGWVFHTEVGFATNAGSHYDLTAKGAYTVREMQGIMMMRTYEQEARAHIHTVFSYFHVSDGTGEFGTMEEVIQNYDPTTSAYIGSTPLPIWYYKKNRVNLHRNFNAWSITDIDGDSTTVTITHKTHRTATDSLLYAVWLSSYSGQTQSNYQLQLPNNAIAAQVITPSSSNATGTVTDKTITNHSITVNIDERVQYVRVKLSTASPGGGSNIGNIRPGRSFMKVKG